MSIKFPYLDSMSISTSKAKYLGSSYILESSFILKDFPFIRHERYVSDEPYPETIHVFINTDTNALLISKNIKKDANILKENVEVSMDMIPEELNKMSLSDSFLSCVSHDNTIDFFGSGKITALYIVEKDYKLPIVFRYFGKESDYILYFSNYKSTTNLLKTTNPFSFYIPKKYRPQKENIRRIILKLYSYLSEDLNHPVIEPSQTLPPISDPFFFYSAFPTAKSFIRSNNSFHEVFSEFSKTFPIVSPLYSVIKNGHSVSSYRFISKHLKKRQFFTVDRTDLYGTCSRSLFSYLYMIYIYRKVPYEMRPLFFSYLFRLWILFLLTIHTSLYGKKEKQIIDSVAKKVEKIIASKQSKFTSIQLLHQFFLFLLTFVFKKSLRLNSDSLSLSLRRVSHNVTKIVNLRGKYGPSYTVSRYGLLHKKPENPYMYIILMLLGYSPDRIFSSYSITLKNSQIMSFTNMPFVTTNPITVAFAPYILRVSDKLPTEKSILNYLITGKPKKSMLPVVPHFPMVYSYELKRFTISFKLLKLFLENYKKASKISRSDNFLSLLLETGIGYSERINSLMYSFSSLRILVDKSEKDNNDSRYFLGKLKKFIIPMSPNRFLLPFSVKTQGLEVKVNEFILHISSFRSSAFSFYCNNEGKFCYGSFPINDVLYGANNLTLLVSFIDSQFSKFSTSSTPYYRYELCSDYRFSFILILTYLNNHFLQLHLNTLQYWHAILFSFYFANVLTESFNIYNLCYFSYHENISDIFALLDNNEKKQLIYAIYHSFMKDAFPYHLLDSNFFDNIIKTAYGNSSISTPYSLYNSHFDHIYQNYFIPFLKKCDLTNYNNGSFLSIISPKAAS